MKMNLEISDNIHEKAALEIVRRLKDDGYEACWVGGCVRNKIMEIPSEDIDIATSARPDSVQEIFSKTCAVGAKFGVVIVIIDETSTEVATFRSDGAYLDKRHPSEVQFSNARKDAMRRDFTVNALFWDPVSGDLHDFVDGLDDIRRKVIRCIGRPEERFSEDALRLLRAIRFSARFAFTIEEQTWSAILRNSSSINSISPERIRDELIKIFTGPNPGSALEMLERSGLLRVTLPEIQAMKGVPQPEKFHPEGDCFEHVKLCLEWLRDPSTTLAFGCLLHDVGKPPTYQESDRIRFDNHTKVGAKIAEDICRRLRFSNREREAIVDLVYRHMHFLSVRDMKKSTLKKFLSHPNIEEDLELHRADCLASHGNLENYHFCMEQLEIFRKEEEKIIPEPLINGNDLINEGYKPGPVFKEILSRVEEAQLEEEVSSKEEAMKLVKKEFPLE